MKNVVPNINISAETRKPGNELEKFEKVSKMYGNRFTRYSKKKIEEMKKAEKHRKSLEKLFKPKHNQSGVNTSMDSKNSEAKISQIKEYQFQDMSIYEKGMIADSPFGVSDELPLSHGVYLNQTVLKHPDEEIDLDESKEMTFGRADSSNPFLKPNRMGEININDQAYLNETVISKGEPYRSCNK